MAGYLGATPVPQATQHRESFTATSGQTTFASAGYTAGFVDVYLNGSHLSPADFTATNGSDVVLASGASADDVCDIIRHSAFEVNAQVFTGVTSFKLASEGSLAMTIDATGAVTKPLQPAFLVHPASAQNNITVGSSPDTVVWGTERFDNNADFASNTFTAPVTGKYQINVNMYLNQIDTASDYYEIQIVSSNKTYFHAFDPGGLSSDPHYWLMSLNQLIDMDASDTALIKFKQGTGTAQTDIAVHSFFSGYLAC